MKRTSAALLILCILAFAIYFFMSGFAESQVLRLLSRYDLDSKMGNVSCSAGTGRSGHCTFTAYASVEEFSNLLSRDLSARKPHFQNDMPPEAIGDRECSKLAAEHVKVLPTTQLGGDDAPYLGAVYIHNSGSGCLEFEFGFG